MASIRDKLSQKKSKLAVNQAPTLNHPADIHHVDDGAFFLVDIHKIKPNPHQPRQHFDEKALEELSDSIKQSGIIQPIVIRKDNEDHIILVAGERRLRAAKLAGLDRIPTILTKGNPIEIALIENLQRENLNPIEESEALMKMINEYNYTQNQLAKVIGKGRSTIAETLSLTRLPESIRNKCRQDNNMSKRVLVEVVKQPDEKAMIKLFEKINKESLTSDQVREITRNPPKPSQKSSLNQRIQSKIVELQKLLTKLSIHNVPEPDRSVMIHSLIKLKQTIELIDIDSEEQDSDIEVEPDSNEDHNNKDE